METLFLNHLYIGVGLPVARQVKFTLSNSCSSEVFVGCTVILTSVPLHSAEMQKCMNAKDYAVNEYNCHDHINLSLKPLPSSNQISESMGLGLIKLLGYIMLTIRSI